MGEKAGAELCQAQGKLKHNLFWYFGFDRFDLIGLVWKVWFGRFGLEGLVWWVWFYKFGLVGWVW